MAARSRRKGVVKAAVVGCGNICNSHMHALARIAKVKVVGLTDLRRSRALAMAGRFELGREVVYRDLDEMLTEAEPDVVIDCTVPAAHYEVTTKALKAGCHVLGEKPMSDSMVKARKMVALAKKVRRIFAVMQNYRYRVNTMAFANLVHEGRIGQLDTLTADLFSAPHFGGFREQIPNPLLVEMGIHTFDTARMISGTDPVWVWCHEHDPKGGWFKGGNAAAVATFQMTKGVVFTYRGHWCANGLNTNFNAQWRAVGDGGSALYDGQSPPCAEALVKLGKPGVQTVMKKIRPRVPKGPENHWAVLAEFIDCIRTGKRPQTDSRDNIKSLAMVFAAIESAKTGRRVKVSW